MSQLLTAPVLPSAVRLNNGLTVIHQYLPSTPVVVADVWVRAGTTQEPEEWAGIAHFLEHMVFKGTEVIAPGTFDREIENRGGMANAATSHDYAHYFLTIAEPYLGDTLPQLTELLLNAAIPEDEFIRERDVVLEEIRQAHDDPDWTACQALSESIYQRHPYGRPVLGTELRLMQHSPQAMHSFHRAHYQPANMTVVIVGGIAQEPALELVNLCFQQFPKRSHCLEVKAAGETLLSQGSEGRIIPPVPCVMRRQELYLPRIEQARLLIAWTGPGVEQILSGYGLDLLSVLLAEGRSSRLVRDLREEQQLVQAISSDFSLQQHSSLFTISAWLEPQNIERVETLICAHINKLGSTPISQEELARCKRFLCNNYAFATETPNQLAGLYGYYSTIANVELATTYPEQIQSFQAEDLQLLAQQYLCPQQYAVTILKPC